MEGGILERKEGGGRMHDVFTEPILAPSNNAIVLDAGQRFLPGAPVICTEFGGVNISPAAREATGDVAGQRDWG